MKACTSSTGECAAHTNTACNEGGTNKCECFAGCIAATDNNACTFACGSATAMTDVTITSISLTSIIITCNPGFEMVSCVDGGGSYTLSDTATRYCVSGTGWVGSGPTCDASLIDCGSPSEPENGFVFAVTTTVGSTALYSCEIGNELVGDSTRTCGASGWGYSEPFCEESSADALVFSTWSAVASTIFVLAMF
ncbi:LEV9-like protein [Mya arenaria]|uniref:LEV9-like protein n=1 Tax=Mya arenaria TaxID=6604 RepID=A0ABY7EMV3_MYAAR|nr:LEV9-like protein [Mya arenaria]